jgi:hypothetical protein
MSATDNACFDHRMLVAFQPLLDAGVLALEEFVWRISSVELVVVVKVVGAGRPFVTLVGLHDPDVFYRANPSLT